MMLVPTGGDTVPLNAAGPVLKTTGDPLPPLADTGRTPGGGNGFADDGLLMALNDIHAAFGVMEADILAARGKPGLLVVQYLPSRLTSVQTLHVVESFRGVGTNMGALERMTEALANLLLRVLWGWNLSPRLTKEALVDLGPLIMGEILTRLSEKIAEGNAPGGPTPAG